MAGQIITITQQKGGSGKTTIAAHLAVASALFHKKKVAIVDTDPQGSLGRWFMTRMEAGISPEMGFRTASAWGARYEAQSLAKDHDLVIIDTPPKLGIDGRPAIETANLVLVPVAASPVDLWATEPTVEMTKASKKPLLMVLNRINARAKVTADIEQALKEMDVQSAKQALGSRVVFAASMGDGLTAMEAQSSSAASQEAKALAAEVIKRLKKL